MAKIQLSTHELHDLCAALKYWIRELEDLHRKIKTKASSLGETWKDPQYELFITIIQSTQTNISGYIEQLSALESSLRKYADMQDELRNKFSNQMRGM